MSRKLIPPEFFVYVMFLRGRVHVVHLLQTLIFSGLLRFDDFLGLFVFKSSIRIARITKSIPLDFLMQCT